MDMNLTMDSKNEVSMALLQINSPKLGLIEYKEDDVITLSTPLLGFGELNDFLLISNETSYPFLWFQSVEDPHTCFILVEAKTFFPDYAPSINKREYKVLNVTNMEEVKTFCIVVVPMDPKKSTANLRAPLIINFEKKLAKQVILEDERYLIKTPLFP